MKILAAATLFLAMAGFAHAEEPAAGFDVPEVAESLLRLAHDNPDAALTTGAEVLKDSNRSAETRRHVLIAMGRAAQWLSRERVLEVSALLTLEPDVTDQALAQVFRAQTLVESGHPDTGLAMLRDAIPNLSAAGAYWTAMADMEMCDAMVTAERPDLWQAPCERARSAWEGARRTLELARTENLISLGHWMRHDFDAALAWARFARAEFERARSTGGMAMMDANLADLHVLTGEPEKALAEADRSLKYELTAGKRVHALSTQNVRAAALTALGRPEEAIAVLDPAIAEAKSLDAARILEDLLSTRLEASSRGRTQKEVAADARALVAIVRSRYSKLVETETANLESVYQIDLKNRQVRRLEVEQRVQLLEAAAARSKLEVATLRGDRLRLTVLLVLLIVAFTLLQVLRMHRQNRALAAENRQRVELVGQAFHEVRNPLVSISGLLDLALQGLGNHPSRSLIASAKAAAAGVAESAQHQLDSVQVARDAVTLYVEAFQPTELIRQVCELISPEAWRKRLQIAQHVSARVPPWLLGDENRIRQVLWNIASNAVKFTARGSVRFDLDYTDDGHLLISVTDTGPGISAADLGRIFEPFQRASTHPSRTYGVGLGLSVADKLVRHMGGRITATAPAEGGMRFDVELPLSVIDPLDAGVITNGDSQRAAAVLIVEDDPYMGELLILQVEQLGARAVHVQTADEAMQTMIDLHPCLVLVDYHLGGETGTDLVGRLRALRDIPLPRIVIMSATQVASPEYLEPEQKPDSLIRKPISRDALHAQLQRAIAARGSASPGFPHLADQADARAATC